MELSDILYWSSIPASFVVGLNIRTFKDSKEWLDSHRIGPSWNERSYEKFKEHSHRGPIVYYLGFPGRIVAYKLYSRR